MSNVLIDRQKIDILANAISDKSGVPVTMTLAEMVEAVDGIETGGGTPTLETVTKTYTPSTSAVTDTITPSSGYDGIEEVDVTVSAVPVANPSIGNDYGFYTQNNNRKWRIRGKVTVDNSDGFDEGYISEGTYYGGYTTYSAIATGTSVTPTESSQTIGGANYMMAGAVTVNAIPSNYVGSGITRCTASDVVFVEDGEYYAVVGEGYYANNVWKEVPSGTAGTPTATKGTVSNHQVSVTPSVTNTAGYISGGTINGTAVTVSASELVSGNLPITQNGNNIDCANYSTVSVNVSGSSKNAQVVQSTTRTNASALTAIGAELTVSKTGTYDIYYSCFRTNTSASYTWATRLYINGTAYGTAENTTWTNNQQNTHLSNISLTTGDKLRVYGRNTRGTSYYICAPTLVIIEA